MVSEDTISAIATALGEGSVGIIRISGQNSLDIVNQLFKAKSGKKINEYPKNTLVYGQIIDENEEIVDEVLVVYMQAPHSYTAEDVVEIQAHGGVQSLKKILSLTYAFGARAAEAGEFTKRAFLNGRIDLVQAEAVMDIIRARSESALKMALKNQQGLMSQKISKFRQELVDMIVHLEAIIDYPEEDIEDMTFGEIKNTVEQVTDQVAELLAQANTGKVMREGLKTVIVGRPNVGKSSLLNALLQEERAIVSSFAGTTRDIIEEQLLIDGIPLILTDTAGIHNTDDYVESIGVEKSQKELLEAELVIMVVDGAEGFKQEDEAILAQIGQKPCVIIINKVDQQQNIALTALEERFGQKNVIQVSALTKQGLEVFYTWLKQFVYGNKQNTDGVYVQNIRHEQILKDVYTTLQEVLCAIEQKLAYDCIIIDLRNIISQLGSITGDTIDDEIINKIFARFCLGK